MDFFTAVAARHSYRGPLRAAPVPREDLARIVDAGIRAPSGKNCQTTHFVVIDDPGLVVQLRRLHATNRAMQTASALIACLVDRDPPPVYEGYDFQIEDCAAAVENMLLAVAALGYASVWIDGWLRVGGRAAAVANLIGAPPEKIVRVLLPIGVPEQPGQQPARRGVGERAWYNRYGGR